MNGRIAIDLSCLEARPETGVERYARRLVEHLPEDAPDLEYVLIVRSGMPTPVVSPPARVHVVPSHLPRALWRESALPRALRAEGLRVLHSPVAAIPFRSSLRRIATIHDVPWFGQQGHEGRLSRNHLRMLHAAQVADRIIVPSAATRDALVERLRRVEAKIRVVPHGVDPDFRPEGLPFDRARHGIPAGPYLLWVGTIRPRKDPQVLVQALADLLKDGFPEHHLVMAGDLRMDAELLREPLRRHGLQERLVIPGYVPREDLPDLYREADVVVVPSRLEGFGLGALEAMASGRPLVVSRDAALKELAGDAALSFATGDAHDLALALRRMLSDQDLRTRCRAAAIATAALYSWHESARRHAAIYRELLAEDDRPAGS